MQTEAEIWMIRWGAPVFLWLIGLLFWYITYIGAPLESKKSGRHVSGVPGTPFICFLIAGLLSPCKWLALLCLSDISITTMPFYSIRDSIRSKKDNSEHSDEE